VLLQVLDGTIQTSGSAYEQIAGQAPGEWEWLYTFSDGAAPGLTIYDYTFQLEWGDGAVSTWTENDPASDMMIVQVSGATNEYQIYGAHTYADPGYYTVTLTVTDDFSVVSWEAANQWILVDQG
jgi:hypothetical protein